MASLFEHIVVEQELEMSSEDFLKLMRIFFVTVGFAVGFVYSRWLSTVTDGECRQIHLTRIFSRALCTSECAYSLHGPKIAKAQKSVTVRVSFHLHAIHDVVCFSVRWLSYVFLSPVSLRLLPLLFHTELVLCPALHLQCRQRRG